MTQLLIMIKTIFMFSLFKSRKKRNFVPGKWEKLYQEKLFDNATFNEHFDKHSIKNIFFLFFSVYTPENYELIISCLHNNNIKKIKSLISKTPLDFDSNDYPMIMVFEVRFENNSSFLIAKEDKNYSGLNSVIVMKSDSSLVNSFETSREIFKA